MNLYSPLTLTIRAVSHFTEVKVFFNGGTALDLGLLDVNEARALSDELRNAADELDRLCPPPCPPNTP